MSELSADTAPAVEPIERKLRDIILEDFPEAVEVVRLGDGAASYGVGPKKMSESHVYVMPQAKYVNLGFWNGVGLPDPEGLLQGTGTTMRHIKVRSVEDAKALQYALSSRRRLQSVVLRLGVIRSNNLGRRKVHNKMALNSTYRIATRAIYLQSPVFSRCDWATAG